MSGPKTDKKEETEKKKKSIPQTEKAPLKNRVNIDRYTSILEAEQIVRRHIPVKKLETVSKLDEVEFIKKWCVKMGNLLKHLSFRVTYAKFAGDLYAIMVSEFRLIDPRTKELPLEVIASLEEQYSEFKMCDLPQRTFTFQARNKKGTYGDLQELGFLKFWKKKFQILEKVNIKWREFKWAPIVFVLWSPGQRERLIKEGIKSRTDREIPGEFDKALVRVSYDITMTEHTMTQLELAVQDASEKEESQKDKDQRVYDDAMYMGMKLYMDSRAAGQLRQKMPNKYYQFITKNLVTIVKYIGIVLVLWFLASVVIAFVTGTPLFSYLPGQGGEAVPTTPGGGAEVITQP